MKHLLLLTVSSFFGFFGLAQNPNECTITPGCTPGIGYCSTPASGGDLSAGDVGVFYSDIVQITSATDYQGMTINSVDMALSSAPAGLTIVFTQNQGIETSCTILGGQSACFTVYGTPTTPGIDQEVTISANAVVDGAPFPIPITLAYKIDINGTASLSETTQKNTFAVYPNPGSGVINITTPSSTTLIIKNILGQEVMKVQTGTTAEINTTNWKNGVYFITNESTGASLKFIKK